MQTGRVYVVHTAIAHTPKDKITICVHAGNGLFLWINTEANARFPKQQIVLQADDHGALSRACHIDCSRVTTFSRARVRIDPRQGVDHALHAR